METKDLSTWRANFYADQSDTVPERTEVLRAKSEEDAAAVAARRMGNAMRVDVVRTVIRD